MRIKYLISVLLFCFSCNQQYKEENVAVAKIIQKGSKIELQKDKKVILIVHVIGCTTCIEPVKNFINKVDNPNFIIVASCYSSKDFYFAFPGGELENRNCIVDTLGLAFRHGLVDVGAKLYFFENGKITDIKTSSCAEPGLLTQTLNFLK